MTTFLCPRASCLKSAASTCRTLKASSAPAHAAFSTTSRPLRHLRTARSRPSVYARVSTKPFQNASVPFAHDAPMTPRWVARAASTASSPASPAPSSGPPPEDAPMSWDRFFRVRRQRRYINLGFSIASAIAAFGIGVPLLSKYDIDSWGAQQVGMDPFIVLGITSAAVAGAGWLAGPMFGNNAVRVWASSKGVTKALTEKEKSFYARVKRYRADPSSSSPQNPIPDYYGEKIGSVKDYRRWLKDQRAFNLKKNKNML